MLLPTVPPYLPLLTRASAQHRMVDNPPQGILGLRNEMLDWAQLPPTSSCKKNARDGKNDIQSWLSHQGIFGRKLGPKWPGICNLSDEKTCRLAHFEARELSYPTGTFWKVQNLEISVPRAPIFREECPGFLARDVQDFRRKTLSLSRRKSLKSAHQKISSSETQPSGENLLRVVRSLWMS